MKIAFDAKRFFHNASGLGNYSRDLVRILATYYPDNEYVLLSKSLSGRGNDILEHPSVNFCPISRFLFSRQIEMGKAAQNLNVGVFHGLSGELPLRWNGNAIKKVVTIHDLIFMRFPRYYPFLDRKIYYWKFKKAVRDSDAIIAISHQTKKDIIKYLGVAEDKIKVIYQGCHYAFKSDLPNELITAVIKKFTLPEKFLLSVGTIEERKNLIGILKSITSTDIPLVIVGGGGTAYFSKVQEYIVSHQLESQVFFLEEVSIEELAVVYRLARIFIYPSFFEGFGIPIIEALYSGTPVITSNIGSMPEAGGKDSLYIDPDDTEDIRSKILFLWHEDSERKRMAEKGLEYVQKFNDDRIAGQLMDLYTSFF